VYICSASVLQLLFDGSDRDVQAVIAVLQDFVQQPVQLLPVCRYNFQKITAPAADPVSFRNGLTAFYKFMEGLMVCALHGYIDKSSHASAQLLHIDFDGIGLKHPHVLQLSDAQSDGLPSHMNLLAYFLPLEP
jgi:hypothetical protein